MVFDNNSRQISIAIMPVSKLTETLWWQIPTLKKKEFK
jgi:hypothetical protein